MDDNWALAEAARDARLRIAADFVRAGVRLLDPWRTWIEPTVKIAPGAVIWPDVVLRGATVIEAGVEVEPGVWLNDTCVGSGTRILAHSVCEGAVIGADCVIGPMAHLRSGAILERGVKVGNFVEAKNTTLREGAKASHLTYLGDAEIGSKANIGAGTITCNYDGFAKYRTEVGPGAFIGSNTALVAPVAVGAGAIVGAGSVVTRDVPDDALAVERAELKILSGKGKIVNDRNRHRAEDRKREAP